MCGVNKVTPALFARYPDASGAGRGDAGRRSKPLIQDDRVLPRRRRSRSSAWRRALVESHAGQVPGEHGGARRAARRRPKDRQRRARPRPRRPGPAGRPPRAARRQPHRPRRTREDPRWSSSSSGTLLPAERWTVRVRHAASCTAGASASPKPLCDRCAVRESCDYFQRGSALVEGARPRRRARAPSRPGPRSRPPAGHRRAAGAADVDDDEPDSGSSSPRRSTRFPARFRTPSAEHRRSSSRTSRRANCSRRWRSSRPTRSSASTRARRSPNATGTTATRFPTASSSSRARSRTSSETEDDVVTEIGETLIHEVGHYFGLSEEEIEEIEERYWNRRQRLADGVERRRGGRGRRRSR